MAKCAAADDTRCWLTDGMQSNLDNKWRRVYVKSSYSVYGVRSRPDIKPFSSIYCTISEICVGRFCNFKLNTYSGVNSHQSHVRRTPIRAKAHGDKCEAFGNCHISCGSHLSLTNLVNRNTFFTCKSSRISHKSPPYPNGHRQMAPWSDGKHFPPCLQGSRPHRSVVHSSEMEEVGKKSWARKKYRIIYGFCQMSCTKPRNWHIAINSKWVSSFSFKKKLFFKKLSCVNHFVTLPYSIWI